MLSQGGLREMQTVFTRLAGSNDRPPSDLLDALLWVIAKFGASDERSPVSPPAWLQRWKTEVMEAGDELAEPIQYWQKKSGRSPEHLARTCREFFLCTPTDILNQRRIERARMLLRSTDEKVISIGYACGFKNLSNFYRNFSARVGITPAEWRHRGAVTVPIRN
jgi:AraC family cel operon transcriptional repressor